MSDELHIDFSEPIALFPINCVLLPGATIPLHIFEPRYKAMTGDALASNSMISMAIVEGDEQPLDDTGQRSLRPHVCVGYIIRHQEYDDGRYDLLLQGVCRARIVSEKPGRAYRRAILDPTDDEPLMEIDLSQERHRLESLLKDPLLSQLANISAVRNWLSHEIPTVTLIDLTLMSVCDQLDERYAMLQETCVHSRFSFLEQYLGGLKRTVAVADRHRPPELGDDAWVN